MSISVLHLLVIYIYYFKAIILENVGCVALSMDFVAELPRRWCQGGAFRLACAKHVHFAYMQPMAIPFDCTVGKHLTALEVSVGISLITFQV